MQLRVCLDLLLTLMSSVVKAGDVLLCVHSFLLSYANPWMGDSVLLSGGDAGGGPYFLAPVSV